MSANKKQTMESNKQVTAVEWFAKQLGIIGTDTLAKAKAMEREQIMNAYNQDLYGGLSGKKKFDNGEQYYNETYEKETSHSS